MAQFIFKQYSIKNCETACGLAEAGGVFLSTPPTEGYNAFVGGFDLYLKSSRFPD